MRKIRLTLGAKDIYGYSLHIDDYKVIHEVVGETPTTVIINVRGEKKVFSKADLIYSE